MSATKNSRKSWRSKKARKTPATNAATKRSIGSPGNSTRKTLTSSLRTLAWQSRSLPRRSYRSLPSVREPKASRERVTRTKRLRLMRRTRTRHFSKNATIRPPKRRQKKYK